MGAGSWRLAVVASIALATPSTGAADGVASSVVFEAAAKIAFAASGARGLSVAVASRSNLLAQIVLGRRRVDRPSAVAPDDPFHLASITKSLTATMIATLVDRGALRWNATPARVWPAWADHIDRPPSGVTVILDAAVAAWAVAPRSRGAAQNSRPATSARGGNGQ